MQRLIEVQHLRSWILVIILIRVCIWSCCNSYLLKRFRVAWCDVFVHFLSQAKHKQMINFQIIVIVPNLFVINNLWFTKFCSRDLLRTSHFLIFLPQSIKTENNARNKFRKVHTNRCGHLHCQSSFWVLRYPASNVYGIFRLINQPTRK